jgi:DegV family protein with EDD domain
MYINVGADSYLDGVDMSRQQFYERLPQFEVHPTTSVPAPGQFIMAYERLQAEGATQILSIHISSSLSAVVNSARLAAEEVDSIPITILDSGNLTLGTGLLALAAAKAVAEGKVLDEVLALLNDQVPRTHCFAALDTLDYLRRSGRLSRLQASLGAVLRVKPVLAMSNGEFEMERIRTRRGAMARVIELVEALAPLEELAVVHTHAPDEAELLREKAVHLFPQGGSPLFAEVTPVIGAHIGPGAVGFVAISS